MRHSADIDMRLVERSHLVKPTVVDIRQLASAEYIGRAVQGRTASPWQNPHKLPADTPADRAKCINAYVRTILASDQRRHLHTLRAKTIGCWCAPKLCHGHALADLSVQQRTHGQPCPHCKAPLKGWLNLWGDQLYEAAVCMGCNARGYAWRVLPHYEADGLLAL